MRAVLAVAAFLLALPAFGQDVTPAGYKLEPLTKITPQTPAKQLFGRAVSPAPLEARAIGFYSKGCLAGSVALPVNGETWQVMRLSRNRMWGHPDLIAFLERFSRKVPQVSSWPGILVGDISQPRGGPMLTGHASHQIGLDADIWLTPMPTRRFSNEEREQLSATNVVASDWNDIDPSVWTANHLAVIKAAAQDRSIERVLVNPAIKKAICREATGDRSWLRKVRPTPGHNYHFHVRMQCPKGSEGCRSQDPPPNDEGCGADLAWWFSEEARRPPKIKPKPKPPLIMADLPAACGEVLVAK